MQGINALLKEVEFVIVPVVNPDGYVVSCVNLRQSSCMFASVGGRSQTHFIVPVYAHKGPWILDKIIVHV